METKSRSGSIVVKFTGIRKPQTANYRVAYGRKLKSECGLNEIIDQPPIDYFAKAIGIYIQIKVFFMQRSVSMKPSVNLDFGEMKNQGFDAGLLVDGVEQRLMTGMLRISCQFLSIRKTLQKLYDDKPTYHGKAPTKDAWLILPNRQYNAVYSLDNELWYYFWVI